MANRVTIQDIADALGVSRNTVSKAINNTGILADATREKVLAKAVEMGYKQFSYANSVNDIIKKPDETTNILSGGEIALFTGNFLGNSHFASTMLDRFQNELTHLGYSMTMHRVSPDAFENLTLPASFDISRTKGIICVEMFNQAYCEMLCSLGLPILFTDAPVKSFSNPLPADILLMDNTSGIYSFVSTMIERGITKIGFIGEENHCRSFFERYLAFRNAMYFNNVPINDSFCLTNIHSHGEGYLESLASAINTLDEFPELFICANDFVAIDLITCLKSKGLNVPDDIMICGFDDSVESRVMTPMLTTCHIHSQIMGTTAANLLISRIKQPELNYRTVYTETNLILRGSTRD